MIWIILFLYFIPMPMIVWSSWQYNDRHVSFKTIGIEGVLPAVVWPLLAIIFLAFMWEEL